LWQYTNTFAPGFWGDGSYPSTNVSLPVAGLAYYYRFYATNSAGGTFPSDSKVLYATNLITWIQTAAGTHYWTNSANWSPAFVPDSAGLSVVITNDYAVGQTINVDQSITLGELAYGNTNVTTLAKLTGGAFRFDNGAKPGRIWNIGATGSIAVDVTFGSSTQLEVQVDSPGLTLSGVLGGFSNLVKSGSGALDVTAANMFTGDLVIRKGQVGTGSSSSVVPDASVVQVENGAVFRMGRTDRIRGARGTGYVTHINGVGNGYLVMGTNTVPSPGYTYLVDGGTMSPGIGTNIGALYTGSSSGGDPAAILGGDIYVDVASGSSYDKIVFVRGSAQNLILGGNLHLNFADSYLPQTGAYWDIISIQTSGTIADTNGGALFTSIDSSISGATLTAEIVTSNKVRVTLQSFRTGTLMIVR
jgi:autotransporter-associated beta strand protein